MCQDCLLDPKLDFVFKKIFGNEHETDVLIRFLNAIFESKCVGKYDPIVWVELKNPEITKSSITAKSSVMDIRAKTSRGEFINIEIQRDDEKNILNRMVFYSSNLISTQLESGAKYQKLSRSVAIVITNFKIKEIDEEDFHNVYRLQNIVSNKELTKLNELHFIELTKMKNIDENNVLQLFLQFLKKPNDEKVIKKSDEIHELSKARERLKFLSSDKLTRQEADEREKELKDVNSKLYDQLVEVAKNFLDIADDETIAEKTGLELEEVQKLRAETEE